MTSLQQTEGRRVSGVAFWAGWVLSILPALALMISASMKIARTQAAVAGFARFGYPEHLLLVLGIIEISCAIVYLIPPTAVLGAILMTGYFGGAIATHIRIGDPGFVTPLVLGVLLWLGLFLREPRLRWLVPFRN